MATLSPPISPQQSRSDRPERPRAVTSMSYASTHSHRTSKSRDETKLDLTETAKDKRRLEGKSDPTKALHEREPAAVALNEDSNLENIRATQHKDKEGNFIMDPDRSNPTRSRMERPLDTIRSFNAAAEGTTSRRTSYQRPSSQVGWEGQSRRTSYYGNQNASFAQHGRPNPNAAPRAYAGQGGYYRNQSHGMRSDAYGEEGPPRQQYQQHQYQRYPQNSAPYIQNGESPNSLHSHHQSYETMTSGSDEMSKSTNPSSQNSSYDQLHQMGRQKPDSGYYETNPYRQPNAGRQMRNPYPPSAMPNGFHPRQVDDLTDDYGMSFSESQAPQPPAKNYGGPSSRPINLNDNSGMPGSGLQKTPSITMREQPKRQSWIKRTFSKKA